MIKKIFNEKSLHFILEMGVLIKMAISIVQIAAAVFLYFGHYDALNSLIVTLGGDELKEIPIEYPWKLIISAIQSITVYPESFWIFILLSHGLIKVFLSIGLWLRKYWAYPLTAAVFTLFAIYQIYQMAFVPSLALALVTLFDILLIVLIIREYRHHRRLKGSIA